MRSWKAWLLVVVIFASGLAAGAFGMRAYMVRRLPEMFARPPERLADRILDHISQEVGLSEAQRTELRPLVEEHVSRAERLHQSIRQDLDTTFRAMDDAIAARLNEGQRAKFAEFRARMEQMRRHGPPPPPPGAEGMPPGLPPGPPPQ